MLKFITFLGTFLIVYGGINFYIFKRIYEFFIRVNIVPKLSYYIIITSITSLSFLFGMIGSRYFSSSLITPITIFGSFWLVGIIYFGVVIVVIDTVRIINSKFGILSSIVQNDKNIGAYGVIIGLIFIFLIVYGNLNSKNIKYVNYEVSIDKKVEKMQELNVVMLSDVHLGYIVDKDRLKKIVNKINHLGPDIVVFAGDTIDHDIIPVVNQKMYEEFQMIESKYGVYHIHGNHEYYGGELKKIEDELEKGNIKVLKDEAVLIEDSFYLVGREDVALARMGDIEREKLDVIMEDVNYELPIILLDHQPAVLNDAMENKVDLQFSGHTHRGQFFPIGLVTAKIFEKDYGYYKKGETNYIISSGVGTWGPPIRLMTQSEIVNVKVKFK